MFDSVIDYLKNLVYMGVFVHEASNVALTDIMEHNNESSWLKEFRPLKTKSICFTHSSASFTDDAQNCNERGAKWKLQSVQNARLHMLININK